MNAKRSLYNLSFGLLQQAVTILLGLLLPRLVLVNLGSEANGLMNSITNFFSYIALLEMGIGSTTIQALYEPLGRKDYPAVNGILAATDRYYKRIGIVYCIALVFFAFVYSIAVESTFSKSTIILVIMLTGVNSVVSYFYNGKYDLLLSADGMNYIYSIRGTILSILTSVSKIVLLITGFGLVAIQTSYCVCCILGVLYIAFYLKRHYSWINPKVKPNFLSLGQKNYVLIHQIAGLVFKNTDTIILTFALGLKSVSIYAMYTLFFSLVSTLISTVTSSVRFVLGQAFGNNREYYLKLHSAYEVISMGMTFVAYCLVNLFILPFLRLYTAGVTDANYIDSVLPWLFTALYLLNNARESSGMTISFAGHFKQTAGRALLETAINLTVTILAVWKFGIYGVLIGTIVALLYRANDMIIYANRKILNRSPWITYRRWLLNILLFGLCTFICRCIPADCSNYFSLIGWAVLEGILILFIFVTVNLAIEKDVTKMTIEYVKPKLIKSN